jgi:hypothetical protein
LYSLWIKAVCTTFVGCDPAEAPIGALPLTDPEGGGGVLPMSPFRVFVSDCLSLDGLPVVAGGGMLLVGVMSMASGASVDDSFSGCGGVGIMDIDLGSETGARWSAAKGDRDNDSVAAIVENEGIAYEQ